MSHYIICPFCRANLKANKLPMTTKSVQCPDCGRGFQVPGTGVTDKTSPAPVSAAAVEPTPEPRIARSAGGPWLAVGAIGAILVVGAGIIAAILFTRQPRDATPAAVAANSTDPAEAVRAKEEAAKAEAEKDKELEQRRERFTNLMIEAGTSYNTKQWDDAVAAYAEAVKLFPDHADAKSKLADAQAFQAKERQAQAEAAKARAEAAILAKQGQAALTEKQYAAAIDFFKLALQKDATLGEASQGLVEAQSAQNLVQLEQKRIDEYQQFILSGKAAQKAGRYADAIKDFIAAQRVVPNDEIAKQLQREAEKQLDGVVDRAERMREFQRLMAQADAAFKNKAFEDAEKGYQRALRLNPNDADAQKGLDEAQKKAKAAKIEFMRWMFDGNAAANAGRFNEAVVAFREAVRLFPNDETAGKALRLAELAQDNQSVFFRAMERASQAMTLKQYGDAVIAYNEALRASPGNVAATQGLIDAQRAFEADQGRRREFERKAAAGLQNLKQQRYADAVVDLRAALKIMPYHPSAAVVERQLNYADAMAKGVAALNAKRANEAIAHFQAALEVFPNDFAAASGLKKARALNPKGGKG